MPNNQPTIEFRKKAKTTREIPLTRADATALWHAVDAMRYAVRAMKDMPDLAEHIPAERKRLEAASRALRKVQALVRASKAVK